MFWHVDLRRYDVSLCRYSIIGSIPYQFHFSTTLSRHQRYMARKFWTRSKDLECKRILDKIELTTAKNLVDRVSLF